MRIFSLDEVVTPALSAEYKFIVDSKLFIDSIADITKIEKCLRKNEGISLIFHYSSNVDFIKLVEDCGKYIGYYTEGTSKTVAKILSAYNAVNEYAFNFNSNDSTTRIYVVNGTKGTGYTIDKSGAVLSTKVYEGATLSKVFSGQPPIKYMYTSKVVGDTVEITRNDGVVYIVYRMGGK